MKRALQLQHHAHTGKTIAHKHTSYRGLFIIVALFGIAVAFVQQAVIADDITVTAKVAAPLPAHPAVFSARLLRSVVNTNAVTVDGTCAYVAPVSIVEVYVNSQFSGSVPCSSQGTFAAPVVLSLGENDILAKTVNITDDYGPDSDRIAITYDPSATPTSSIKPATIKYTPPSSGVSRLVLTSKHTYLTYGPAKNAVWEGTIEGGTLPYKVTIDWGDGSSSTYTVNSNAEQSFNHHYTTFEPYFLTLTVSDASGQTITHQFAAVTPYIESVAATDTSFDSAAFQNRILTYIMFSTIAALSLIGTLAVVHSTPVLITKPHAMRVRVTQKRGRR